MFTTPIGRILNRFARVSPSRHLYLTSVISVGQSPNAASLATWSTPPSAPSSTDSPRLVLHMTSVKSTGQYAEAASLATCSTMPSSASLATCSRVASLCLAPAVLPSALAAYSIGLLSKGLHHLVRCAIRRTLVSGSCKDPLCIKQVKGREHV